MLKPSSYRETLRAAFRERQLANPLYSMRAFARQLQLTPSMLSLVLRGKRGLSHEAALRAVRVLGLQDEEADLFLTGVEATHARSSKARSRARATLREFSEQGRARDLRAETFRLISDWPHLTLLEMMKLRDYQEDAQWMATRIGVTLDQIKDAISRLKKLELIQWNGKRHHPVEDAVFTTEGVPSMALRKYHRQMIDKAALAIAEQSIDERYLNTSVIAVDSRDLPEIKRRIHALHIELMRDFGASTRANRVVALASQLFQVTRPEVESTNPKRQL